MNIFKEYRALQEPDQKNLKLILVNYFFILFTYPIIRSLATSYFLESYGAKDTPLSWLYSIALLVITIGGMNKFLYTAGVQKVFSVVSAITILTVLLPWISKIKVFSFLFFVWKEAYIVVLIHSFLAYTNSYFKLDDFKNWLGVVAGAGSIGGILGGFILSGFVTDYGLGFAFILVILGLIIPAVLFHFCKPVQLEKKAKSREPLVAIKGVGSYVLIIGILVTLSQFVINIADFKFHIIFEKNIVSKIARTEFLGNLYGTINVFSLLGQFFIMPILMRKMKASTIHLLLPISFMIVGGFGFMISGALGAGATFIYFKGSDYSFFSMAKELLYHPLENIQKFGAKYINDMFVYRFAKALIAIVLYFVQKPLWVDTLFIICLCLWFLAAMVLKKEFKKIKGISYE